MKKLLRISPMKFLAIIQEVLFVGMQYGKLLGSNVLQIPHYG